MLTQRIQAKLKSMSVRAWFGSYSSLNGAPFISKSNKEQDYKIILELIDLNTI